MHVVVRGKSAVSKNHAVYTWPGVSKPEHIGRAGARRSRNGREPDRLGDVIQVVRTGTPERTDLDVEILALARPLHHQNCRRLSRAGGVYGRDLASATRLPSKGSLSPYTDRGLYRGHDRSESSVRDPYRDPPVVRYDPQCGCSAVSDTAFDHNDGRIVRRDVESVGGAAQGDTAGGNRWSSSRGPGFVIKHEAPTGRFRRRFRSRKDLRFRD